MEDMIAQRTKRARELLATARHMAIATVNEDGSPHNTPVFFVVDREHGQLYWSSNPDSLHSQNIARSGQVFMVIFESDKPGGLFMQASKAGLIAEEDIPRALETFNAARTQANKPALPADTFQSGSQRLYVAKPDAYWVNLKDTRYPVDADIIFA